MMVIATEFFFLSSLMKYTYITHLVQIPSNDPFSLMKSAHCFPKIPLEHSILQPYRKLLTLKQAFSFPFPRKNENICQKKKKMFKHNRPRSIRLSKGRKSCGKSKNCLCGKGFQCSVFSNLSEFNTLNGIVPATTLKIYSRNRTHAF